MYVRYDGLEFSWDDEKARQNRSKHGIAFDVAMRAFSDPKAIAEMDRVVDGEERWRTIGRVGSATVLFVAHTWTTDDGQVFVRIISARKADRYEVRAYERGDERHFR